MDNFIPPVDCNNQPVTRGDKVRLLKVPNWLLEKVSNDEAENLKSMIGEVFIVDEIDEYGGVWVEKLWKKGKGIVESHSLSLASGEMELV